jgi:hypothetical protein
MVAIITTVATAITTRASQVPRYDTVRFELYLCFLFARVADTVRVAADKHAAPSRGWSRDSDHAYAHASIPLPAKSISKSLDHIPVAAPAPTAADEADGAAGLNLFFGLVDLCAKEIGDQ